MSIRYLTAGESHGPSQVAILEGMPAGLPLTELDIQTDLNIRKSGAGRGGRGGIETDSVQIVSGVRFGKTLGSPIALLVKNADFKNWENKMSISNNSDIQTDKTKVRNPRPGHADLPGVIKYGFDDVRNVLERASARETLMRTAVGAIARKFLMQFTIQIASHTIQIGTVRNDKKNTSFDLIKNVYDTDPDIRCTDTLISIKMRQAIREATIQKDTLGGVIEVIARNIPVGLGSYVHYDRRLDGRIAQALMSIPSVKTVEIGNGIESTKKFGSVVQDEIYYNAKGFHRNTNNAGGIEGGMSNGEDIVLRVYHKPISTLGRALHTVDIQTKEPTLGLIERSDICIIPRAGIVSESGLAIVLADAMLEKFGSDSMDQILQNFTNFNKK